MSKFEYILSEVDELGINTITINQAKKLNALSRPLLKELDVAVTNAINDENIKSILLTGAGEKAFVAGADISEFKELNGTEAVEMARFGQELFRKIETSPKATIAAVNGFSLGGGCELAMACQMRVASENAKFGQPEVNLGLLPGYGGTQRLVQLVGKGKAMELLMTGDMVGAEDALRLGLVNHVTTQEELINKCKGILKKIGKKAPIAIAKVVACVDAGLDPNQDGYDAEAVAFGECFLTEDFTEGVTAFLEKRKANFKGK